MSRSASPAEAAPVAPAEARRLFSDLSDSPALAIAVSGGPDSLALMWLLAGWRKARRRGPKLFAFTVDHGLRAQSRGEARAVKRLAAEWGLSHRTLTWNGAKPASGLQAAAREARYKLLVAAAARAGATHLLTAHTQDDQAETILFRMSRGSGLSGLAGMARLSVREGIVLARPLLDISKARLLATLRKAGIEAADDPTNRDPRFARSRWRALMPGLAGEGLDAAALSRLARRLARADVTLEAITDHAQRTCVENGRGQFVIARHAFDELPAEVALRLLGRLIGRAGYEGPVELGKLEALITSLPPAKAAARWRRTLAGAVVTATSDKIVIAAAPPRRK